MAVITQDLAPEQPVTDEQISIQQEAHALARFFLKMRYHQTTAFHKECATNARHAQTIDTLLETLFVRDWTPCESFTFIMSAAAWFVAHNIPVKWERDVAL